MDALTKAQRDYLLKVMANRENTIICKKPGCKGCTDDKKDLHPLNVHLSKDKLKLINVKKGRQVKVMTMYSIFIYYCHNLYCIIEITCVY